MEIKHATEAEENLVELFLQLVCAMSPPAVIVTAAHGMQHGKNLSN